MNAIFTLTNLNTRQQVLSALIDLTDIDQILKQLPHQYIWDESVEEGLEGKREDYLIQFWDARNKEIDFL